MTGTLPDATRTGRDAEVVAPQWDGTGLTCHVDGTGNDMGGDPVAEAFRAWMRVCAYSGRAAPVESEVVGLARAVRRITAEPILALWSSPSYRAAAMDGIAVRALDTAGASEQHRQRVGGERFLRVDTGDPVPDQLDAVVMREDVEFDADGDALVRTAVVAGRHVRQVGEDIRVGQVVVDSGHRIRPIDTAALAAAGHATVLVRRRPVVAILPTGDEIRPLGTVPTRGQVLDTNSLMLAAMVDDAGGHALCLPIAPDQPDSIAASVVAAGAQADLVLVIAGSSAGRDDRTAAVLGALGVIAVHGVAMRPGHPVVLAQLTGRPSVPVIGVPGYPAAAERVFTSFALPLLRRLLAVDQPTTAGIAARLGTAIHSATHLDEQIRLRLARVPHPQTGRETLVATPLRRGAAGLDSMIKAEATLRIPTGHTTLDAGSEIWLEPSGGAAGAGTILVSGLTSPAVTALIAVARDNQHTVHWTESAPLDAAETLLDVLCHGVALRLNADVDVNSHPAVATIATRAGELTLLEIARTVGAREVLVIPGAAFDSPAIDALRAVLRSVAFRRELARCQGYSGRQSGRETWHNPDLPVDPTTPTPPINDADRQSLE